MSQQKSDPPLPGCIMVPPGFRLVTEQRLVPDESYAPNITPEAASASAPEPPTVADEELAQTRPMNANDEQAPRCSCPPSAKRGRK